ncbi:hypothetical protein [Corynebacterium sp.]|uniref:hypothetical protein n=1 Tax=Corynebacterium sp. TaxID=1720 RepID=UPI0026DCA2AE|nr:hypothetical protein [Corynebacterium sp.]MDO5032363.1 hypothetical protein [Corynebacterium sp.]
MTDPRRQERTLAALRNAWEGQPDVSLSTFFAMLAAEGYGWGVEDEELIAKLEEMAAVRPPLLPLDSETRRAAEGLWLAVTESHRVTLSATQVVVRPLRVAGQPTAWAYSSLRPVGPNRPLVVCDAEGFEHRFGVVSSVTRLGEDARPLTGLNRRSVGERAWFIRTEEETIFLDHGLRVYTKRNRQLEREEFAWQRIVTGEVGRPLEVQLARGTRAQWGSVQEILLAEAPPWQGPAVRP